VVGRVPTLTLDKSCFVPTCTGPNWLFQNVVIDTYGGTYCLVHTVIGLYVHNHYHYAMDGNKNGGVHINLRLIENR
jgi:hypothetical protein